MEKQAGNLLLDTLRVVPEQQMVEANPLNDRLTDFLAILLIFSIAFYIRVLVRTVIIGYLGDHIYIYTVSVDDFFGVGSYLGLEPGDQVKTNGYDDFHYYYIDYVNAFTNGWNPYTGSIESGDHIAGYVYGPIYIYTISLGTYFFDLSAYDSVLYSNLTFDAASYVMVYLIGKRVTGNVIAFFVAIIGSFSPIAVFYMGLRLLNAPAMTFFALVFVYYFLEKKDFRSTLFLAIAVLVKQFPLFLALPFGFWMWRRYGFTKGTGFILLFIFDLILFSLPWLVKTPYDYVVRFLLPGHGKQSIACPSGGEATNLFHSMLSELCTQYPETAIPDEFITLPMIIVFRLVNYHIVFFFFVILFGLVAFTGYDYFERDNKKYLIFFAMFYSMVHATIARGIFKYYLAMLIPFLLLAFLPGDSKQSMNLKIGNMLHSMFAKALHPRRRWKYNNLNYWLFMIILVTSLISLIWVVDAAVSLFAPDKFHTFWLVNLIPILVFTLVRSGGSSGEHNWITSKGVFRLAPALIALLSLAFYGMHMLLEYYFADDADNLSRNVFIIASILFVFIILPLIERVIFREERILSPLSLSYKQLIWDIVFGILGYIILTYFHREVILVSKVQNTLPVFYMGFLLMGMLGGEIWGSLYIVPRNAIKRYKSINRSHPQLQQVLQSLK